jgi:uncharacterized protein YkwD
MKRILLIAFCFGALSLYAEPVQPQVELEKINKELINSLASKQSLKERIELVNDLNKARQEALKFINDTSEYTDDHTKGQTEVIKLVSKLQKSYVKWKKFIAQDEARLKNLPPATAKNKLTQLDKLEPVSNLPEEILGIDELRVLLYFCTADYKNLVNSGENLLKNTALPEWKQELLSRYVSEGIMQYNLTVKHSMIKIELQAVDCTNEYRMLLGLRALEIDERLVQAARKHSKETTRFGLHGHDEPTKGRETPEQRCALEKYEGGVGENFSGCATSGLKAVGVNKAIITTSRIGGWFYSAGHHRNMVITAHRQIGVGMSPSGGCRGYTYGKCVNHWTQNFGSASAFDEKPDKSDKQDKPEDK